MCGFMIPFLLTLSLKDQVSLNLLYPLCMFTQVMLMVQEFAQLKEQKLDYFKDTNNLLESSQFIFFTFLFLIKLGSQFTSDSFVEIILQSILLVQTFNKVFYFLRMWDQLSYIFTMSYLIIGDTIPYLVMVAILMTSLCMQYTSLHIGVNDPSGEYGQIDSDLVKLMIQMYRSNKGATNVPMLTENMAKRVANTPNIARLILGLNMSVWVFQQLIFILITAVFTWKIMIAAEKYSKQMPLRLYQKKAQMNVENFDIMDNFFKERKFKVICFSFDKRMKWDVYKEWNGQVNQVENQIMIQDFDEEIKKEEMEDTLQTRHDDLMSTKEIVDELFYKIQDLNKTLEVKAKEREQNMYNS